MSNVNERQKRHREKHIEKGAKRLDMLISKESSHQLTMIALYGRGGMKKACYRVFTQTRIRSLNE